MSEWTELAGYPREIGGHVAYRGARARLVGKKEKVVKGLAALTDLLESLLYEARGEGGQDAAGTIERALDARDGVLRTHVERIHFVRVRGTEMDLAFAAAELRGVGRVYLDLAGPPGELAGREPPPGAPEIKAPARARAPSIDARMEAAESGDLAVVSKVGTAALDQCDRFGRTMLSLAARSDHAELVATLLDRGASPDAHQLEALYLRYLPDSTREVARGANHTLLHIAAWGHAPAVVDLLLARGFPVDSRDPYGATPLIAAAMHDADGAAQVIERLLAAGADIAAYDAMGKTAIDHAGRHDTVALLLRAGASPDGGPIVLHRMPAEHTVPPLERFAAAGDIRTVLLLLEKGADAQRAPEALAAAVRGGSTEVAEALLARAPSEAALDQALHAAQDRPMLERLLDVGAKDLDGALAIWIGDETPAARAISEWLVERGARARKSARFPFTALQQAVRFRHDEGFALAMRADPEIDATDADGRTALHHAAFWAMEAYARALVAKGADVRAKDARGLTPYEFGRTSKETSEAYRATLRFLSDQGGGAAR